MEHADYLDWEPGAGLVYLRRLNRQPGVARRLHGDGPAAPGEADAVAVSWRAVHLPSAGPRQNDRRRVTLRGVGSLSPVTVPLRVEPVTYHGGWRWLRPSARLCNSMSDYERQAGAL